MQNLKHTIVFLFLLLASLTSWAQTGKLYNTENGLSSSFANQVFQDSRGFIWVATRNGLNIFDGYHFDVVNRDNAGSLGFDCNYINKVEQDHQGNILLGTNKGLLSFDGRRYHAYKIYDDQHRVVKTYVNDILVRRSGQVLVATSGFGILQPSDNNKDYACLPVRGGCQQAEIYPPARRGPLRTTVDQHRGRTAAVYGPSGKTVTTPCGRKCAVCDMHRL